ncbi:MAG TPA: ferric reductase-like transmembrane domain-containing protein [Candidatus Dormibacteraeota bacterium]|nr:ferric reductase-like transmembrane domain-containing protein [Candidatus Dormibacteraeota bacterium]
MSNAYLWYATRGAGAVSLILLSAVTVLGILSASRYEAPGWPRFVTTGFHRNLSLLAVVFLALHIVTAVVDPYTSLGWTTVLIPFTSSYRTLWLGLGTVAFDLLLAILATSLLRRFIGQPVWRGVHWLAYACWPIAVLHGLGTGTDAWSFWLLVIQSACVLAVVTAIIARLTMAPVDPLAAERANFRDSTRRGDGR